MKRGTALTGIVLLGVIAIVVSERRRVSAEADPSAVLHLVADTERELTRMPVRFARMSDAEEIAIGDELARYYEADQQTQKDPERLEIEHYLTETGGRLAQHAHRKLPYKFHYVSDANFINAYALPGGHIFVGAGLMALMDSEDELAAVVGHEIEHVDHFHCAERVQVEQALRRLRVGGLTAMPIEVFQAGYSKEQEMEADREGTRLAVSAGYSANGAIRMFEAMQGLAGEQRERPRDPGEELSDVAKQTLEGYFRTHPLTAERIAQVQQLIASEGWPAQAEKDLKVAYVFWTNRAQRALEAKAYARAEQLAKHALEMRPGQARALSAQARAQRAQANFAGEAASYRTLLALNPSDAEWAEAYASALAAADRRTAAGEFTAWARSAGAAGREDLQVASAGLALVGGDPGPAAKAAETATASTADWAPVWLGHLAWWYYRAGDYATASKLFDLAVQLRPGESSFSLGRAWTQIEERRYSDAIQALDSASDSGTQAQRNMALACAYWLSKQPDAALSDFGPALEGQPEWGNARWSGALYSAHVVEAIAEMRAEAERRRKAQAATQ